MNLTNRSIVRNIKSILNLNRESLIVTNMFKGCLQKHLHRIGLTDYDQCSVWTQRRRKLSCIGIGTLQLRRAIDNSETCIRKFRRTWFRFKCDQEMHPKNISMFKCISTQQLPWPKCQNDWRCKQVTLHSGRVFGSRLNSRSFVK